MQDPMDRDESQDEAATRTRPPESASAGTPPPTHETGTEPAPASSGSRLLSTPALILGFIIVALLGVVIFQNVFTNPNRRTGSGNDLEFEIAKADLESAATMLNRDRMALGLEPIGGEYGAEAAEQVAERLKSDADTLASLAGSIEELLARKENELDASRKETVSSLKEQKRLRDLLSQTNAELRKAMIDASLAGTLATDLERVEAELLTLREENARLRSEPGALRQELMASEEQRRALEARVAELEKQLSQSSLFAGTEAQIMKEAIALFRALRELEGKSDSEISSAYSQFGARLNANVLKTCNFETGSAAVPDNLAQTIVELPDEVPEGAMIFVVGYASETGNVDSNRALSSERATNVAQILDASKRSNQNVQAAFLGQTDRFSSGIPERNQIVEIWQIEPRTEPR